MTKYNRKDDLLKDIYSERKRLEKLLSSIPEDRFLLPGVVGEWSVKDVLAHLVEWEQLFLEWYRCGIDGSSPSIQPVGMSKTVIDRINQEFYNRNRLRPLQDIFTDFQASYQAIYKTILDIPEEDLFSHGRFAWTSKWILADYIAANTCNHYHWASGKIKSAKTPEA